MAGWDGVVVLGELVDAALQSIHGASHTSRLDQHVRTRLGKDGAGVRTRVQRAGTAVESGHGAMRRAAEGSGKRRYSYLLEGEKKRSGMENETTRYAEGMRASARPSTYSAGAGPLDPIRPITSRTRSLHSHTARLESRRLPALPCAESRLSHVEHRTSALLRLCCRAAYCTFDAAMRCHGHTNHRRDQP